VRSSKLLPIFFGFLLAILFSLVLDRGLGTLGFPAEPTQIAHPANFSETRSTLDFSYHFQTNSQGIRYPEIPIEKPRGERRVVVVGDSFTEGWGVESDKVFTTLLENNFSTPDNITRFINCGLSGTAPLQYARILFQVCLNYHPDAVLIVLYSNDVVGTPVGATPEQIDQIEIKRTGLDNLLHTLWPHAYTIISNFSKQSDLPTDIVAETAEVARAKGIPEEEITNWVNSLPPEIVTAVNAGEFNGYILTRGLLQQDHWVQSLAIESKEAEERFQAMISILNATIARLQKQNIEVGVILIPSPFQYNPAYGAIWAETGTEIRSEWLTEPTELEQRMEVWATTQNVPYLDLTPHFRSIAQASPDILYNYPLDGHWTAESHRVAADEIARWLTTWYFQ